MSLYYKYFKRNFISFRFLISNYIVFYLRKMKQEEINTPHGPKEISIIKVGPEIPEEVKS